MLSLRIAARYLFSPKSHSAINAITLVASLGVAVITAAMICILSVYNGFESLVRSLTSRIDPDIRIEAVEGRFFSDSETLRQTILSLPEVEMLAPMLEEQVLLSFSGQQLPASARGIDSLYAATTDVRHCLFSAQQGRDTRFAEGVPTPSYAIPGIGLAAQLGLSLGMVRPIALYLPDRKSRISASTLGAGSLEESGVFHRTDLYVPDFLRVNQAEYDERLLLLSLAEMRQLMGDSLLLSSYELRLRPGAEPAEVQQQLNRRLAAVASLPPLRALTAADLQADAYRIMRIEKWITYLLVLCILLIATFNIIGALSMLIIDKESQTRTLLSMGAPTGMIRRIYLWLGMLIAGAGASIGICLGVVLILIQQHYGLITLGDEALYIVSAYPVQLLWSDVLLTLGTVILLGGLATYYTVYGNRWNERISE